MTHLAIKRVGRYLCKETIQPIPGERNILAVWSRPDIHHTTKPLQARLESTGVGLLALLGLDTFHSDLIPLEYLRALGRFIVYMQPDAESFYSSYVPLLGGYTEQQHLYHYPSEVMLGLVMLYEKDPSHIWIETAYTALAYLVNHRQQLNSVQADPWLLLTIAKILSLENLDKLSISKELLITHAIQICEMMLQHQVYAPRRPLYDGGFVQDGRTAPTATWLEGLLAALTFFSTDHEITTRIRTAVNRGVKFLLRAQIRDGEFVGAVPRAVGRLRARRSHAAKFNQRATEVRIDYVQHTMSAWMQYLTVA
ncbi:hypothetical protein IQ260_18845 [Leptolyngbya cf. ectocarpi LEGE 11479]|uniref:Uncharacterized protein n=1 Tax=Leptolyngbya cf. ectocarpi LEGE 11479 TaxID=1828722 RepID=A0A929FBI3_LEPEC|nr:hypothetical protein [Leptolyngbya ectocarpi]MBE9068708.1 hypothetical protein [Leptolyngbya cf. ectocarpi LEGE 11479]